MRFYRRLQPFKAISFDLDDTLYSNRPIMVATDKSMSIYFAKCCQDYAIKLPENLDLNACYWFAFRQQAIQQQPALKHDVGLLREKSYYLGALALGLTPERAKEFAANALAYFVEQRSLFSLPQQTHDFLAYLQKKCPLVAITNGNVDMERININQYFTLQYSASIIHKRKPDSDMFDKATSALGIAAIELLHVGDCGKNDVFGGVEAGCQTAWINKYSVGKPLNIIPTLMLDEVEQLRLLLA